MSAIVPGRSWCTTHTGTGIVSSYGLLGPLAEGDYLRRLMVMLSVDGAQEGRFAATIGPSDQATLQSYEAGIPVIQRSNVTSGIVPCIYWHAAAGAPAWFWIPVGIVGSVGARYVVFAWNTLHGETQSTIVVGADVLRFEREPRGMGQG